MCVNVMCDQTDSETKFVNKLNTYGMVMLLKKIFYGIQCFIIFKPYVMLLHVPG